MSRRPIKQQPPCPEKDEGGYNALPASGAAVAQATLTGVVEA